MLQWLYFVLPAFVTALQPLPPVQWSNNRNTAGFSLETAQNTIYIDRQFAKARDSEGLTLIPPSALEFAETFSQDIGTLFGGNWTLQQVDVLPTFGIRLGPFRGDASKLTYENGLSTEEGYELDIGKGSVYIGGSGARGMFWGTRTLIQELSIANGSALPTGLTTDAPAYATRGYMLDAGRKWYTAEFLKEFCTYASFFKVSEFHYHSSDNYPLNRGRNETWNEVFSHFSLYPENNKELQGIIQRKNETLSQAEFEDFQMHCTKRGVTVIPEIEAPGHALAITKWKPELALAKKDLLNLTHPDAIPTVKAIWAEFLPWFQTKEVHIGADEYDPELADDYINFVNEMADFVNITSGKRIRIWGTNEPSENLTTSKDIIVQHWQYGQSDPTELQNDGYQLINSEDWWAYMSLKNDHSPILPATYPQFYNVTRTMNFANVPGWQWDPSLFNPVNTSLQLGPGASGNKGAILAAWSDNGPDATTQLEAYYAMREGIPVMAARAWSGARGVNVSVAELAESIELLASKAPGQNLDRRIALPSNHSTHAPLITWTSTSPDATNTSLNKRSYGPPYTLTLNVSGPFTLSGPDTTLSLATCPSNTSNSASAALSLIFTTSDNFPYPLRSVSPLDGHDPGHPARIWTNQTSSTHDPVPLTVPATLRLESDVVNGTRVWVNGSFAGRFEVFVYGGRNTLFSWSQMALVAPLDRVVGGVQGVVLEAGIGRGVMVRGDGKEAVGGCHR
ncbi:glycoside hydrolase superfamily [Ampelomyces quisqualis]|uniref:beta-N-acetylhexosaminidase n=1 Tax=Ampelomyces quisqualis TaxID=50730 RepID=A0A6A5QSW2_AMPQU|nr:glycoside hydrolase superfamily [Ampelomyces quisqualis]